MIIETKSVFGLTSEDVLFSMHAASRIGDGSDECLWRS